MDAVIRAARDNEAIAIGFAACARNVLPFMEVGGEQEIWANIVAEIERKVRRTRRIRMGDPCFDQSPENQA